MLNGWLVGTLWLVVGIAMAEWWDDTRPRPAPMPRGRWMALPVALLLAGAVWVTVFYDKAQTLPWTGPADVTLAAAPAVVEARGFPAQAESVLGTPLEPINLILVARDEQAVSAAMQGLGWVLAEIPGPAGRDPRRLERLAQSGGSDRAGGALFLGGRAQ